MCVDVEFGAKVGAQLSANLKLVPGTGRKQDRPSAGLYISIATTMQNVNRQQQNRPGTKKARVGGGKTNAAAATVREPRDIPSRNPSRMSTATAAEIYPDTANQRHEDAQFRNSREEEWIGAGRGGQERGETRGYESRNAEHKISDDLGHAAAMRRSSSMMELNRDGPVMYGPHRKGRAKAMRRDLRKLYVFVLRSRAFSRGLLMTFPISAPSPHLNPPLLFPDPPFSLPSFIPPIPGIWSL